MTISNAACYFVLACVKQREKLASQIGRKYTVQKHPLTRALECVVDDNKRGTQIVKDPPIEVLRAYWMTDEQWINDKLDSIQMEEWNNVIASQN